MDLQPESEAERGTLIQRVTRIFRKDNKNLSNGSDVAGTVKPVESEEQKQQRLEAYRKMCEEESKKELESTAVTGATKEFKFRAKDFNH